MRPHPSQSPIRPKISTMQRPKTEAAAYLDIYKLVTEKKRLEQELERLEQRRDLILKRLDVLNSQVDNLETTAQEIRHNVSPTGLNPSYQEADSKSFNTLYLEY